MQFLHYAIEGIIGRGGVKGCLVKVKLGKRL